MHKIDLGEARRFAEILKMERRPADAWLVEDLVKEIGDLKMLVGKFINPGDKLDTWCSACNERTPHRYEPDKFVKLVCERCEEESETK